jgi:hypothetical protein
MQTKMSSSNDDIFLGIGRLEGKIDTLITAQGRLESELKDLTRRVGSLERDRAKLYGAAAAFGILSGLFGWLVSSIAK